LGVAQAGLRHEVAQAGRPDGGVEITKNQCWHSFFRFEPGGQFLQQAVASFRQFCSQRWRRVDAKQAYGASRGNHIGLKHRKIGTDQIQYLRFKKGIAAHQGNAQRSVLKRVDAVGKFRRQRLHARREIRRGFQHQHDVHFLPMRDEPLRQGSALSGSVELQEAELGRLLMGRRGQPERQHGPFRQRRRQKRRPAPMPGPAPEQERREEDADEKILKEKMGQQFRKPVPVSCPTQQRQSRQQTEAMPGVAGDALATGKDVLRKFRVVMSKGHKKMERL
jgi:hypothetical protein